MEGRDAETRHDHEDEHEPVAGRNRGEGNPDSRKRHAGGKQPDCTARSDQSPNSGCTIDDETADARMTAAASVYESANLSTKNGNSAGSAPFAKSVARWPLESAAIARLSSSARTGAG
jgi:hypothetical protein